MEKIVKFIPAFDKRHGDPAKNYGIGSVRCFMLLKEGTKAVHFSFSTGMYLPGTIKEYHRDGRDLFHYEFNGEQSYYMGYDVGYHSDVPVYEGQEISRKVCDWIGCPCYGDGSALRAEKFMKVLVEEGSDAIWKMLEEDLKELIAGKR